MRADVPQPVPGSGQLLVRVHAAGLNPVDYKTRDGKVKIVVRNTLPVTMGNECSGVVEALGAGAQGFAVGDAIFARVEKKTMGTFADYAVVLDAHAAKAPKAIDLVTAAGVPLAGLTALQVLRDELHMQPGMRVLITGGAGGVGTFAIQIAKKLGAHVTTTASSRGAELCTKLGADVVVDYNAQSISAAVALGTMDGAFDTVGGASLDQSFGTVKAGGTVVSIAGMPEPQTALKDLQRGPVLAAMFYLASTPHRRAARKHGVKYRYLFMHPSGTDLALLAEWIEQRALVPVVDRVFPFDEIGAALAHLEAGRAKGKVIVQMV